VQVRKEEDELSSLNLVKKTTGNASKFTVVRRCTYTELEHVPDVVDDDDCTSPAAAGATQTTRLSMASRLTLCHIKTILLLPVF